MLDETAVPIVEESEVPDAAPEEGSVDLQKLEADAAKEEKSETPAEPPAPQKEAASAGPRKRSAHERIGEITEKFRNEEKRRQGESDRADTAERRIQELEATVSPKEEPSVTPKEPSVTPLEEDYETQDEYLKELTKWEVSMQLQEKDQAVAAAQAEARAQNNHRELMKTWDEQVAVAIEAHPDFEEVVTIRPNNPAIEAEIMDSPYGAEMAYYYGTNREEAERVFAMPAYLAAREIHKLEHQFVAAAPLVEAPTETPTETPSAPPKVPRPPKPAKPLGASAPTAIKTFKTMTPAEYYKHRQKEMRANEEI